MHKIEPIKVNHFDKRSRERIIPNAPLLSTKALVPQGINFDYYQYDAHEIHTHTTEHHVVCLPLDRIRPERKLNNIYQHEESNPGSVHAIPAQTKHWVAWNTPGRFIIFSIQPQALKEIAPETIDPDKIELLPAFSKPEPDPLIASIGVAIKEQLKTNPADCSFYLEHLSNAFLAHLVQNYCSLTHLFKEYGDGLPRYKLKRAIDYINDNLEQKINTYDIAKLLDISNFYFCRMFKASTGISPYKYDLRQRVSKAKDL
ncbi:MAG: hypothetical protein ACFCAD_20740, partial [Pleurocapsa sp.]